MKKRACSGSIPLLILLFVSVVLAAEPRLVKVGAFNYYPAIFKDKDGVIKGFYVDALNDLAKRENLLIEYVYGSWNEGLEQVKSGDVDLLTSVAYTPERSEYLDYAKLPLLTVWGELYARDGSPIAGITDVEGKTIAIMKGDVNGANFVHLVKRFNIRCSFVELPGFEDVFKAVAKNKVDAGVVNCTFGAPKKKDYGLHSTGVVFEPFDIYFAVPKGKNQDLLKLLDTYLKDWRNNDSSVYAESRHKWLHPDDSHQLKVPAWLLWATFALTLLALVAIAFVISLRRQVGKKTNEIIQQKHELQESEERYRSIFENSSSVMLLIESETATIVDANPAAATYYGWPLEQLRQMPLATINILTTEQINDEMQQAHQKNRCYFQSKHRLANGAIRDVEVFSGPIQSNGKARLFSIIHDITERKLVENTLLFLLRSGARAATEDFFQSLARYLAQTLDMAYVCIVRLRGDGFEAQTVVIYQDGRFEHNVRYHLADTPCGEVVGKSICIFEHSVRQRFPNNAVLQELSAESYVGATLWGFDSKPVGLIAVIGRQPLNMPSPAESMLQMVAISAAAELEHRQAEEALLENESRYRTLVEYAPVALLINKNDQVTLVNKVCLNLFGATDSSQLVGRSPFELFHADYHEKMRERITQQLAQPTYVPAVEGKIVRLDGTVRNVEVTATSFQSAGETAIHVVLQDITERKLAERTQHQLEEQLRHSQRMEAIGTLAGGIAHDFNNILTAIIGYAHISQMGLPPDAPQIKHIQSIVEAANKATRLTRDLLLYSRKSPASRKVFDLNETLDTTMNFLQRIISERITLEARLCPQAVYIDADPQQLDQVFVNLATNARDAMPDGGTITISTDLRFFDEQAAAELALPGAGRYALICFSDTGCGINEDHLRKIFDPFFTTKEVGQGTGLGLPIVYGIIANHNGVIRADSTQGNGAALSIYLPYCEKPITTVEQAQVEAPLPRGTETILVAEDDERIRVMVSQALTQFGYQVLTAVDGKDALRVFREHSDRIQLCLFDLVMPTLGGFEAYQQLRETHPDLPVLFTSGYTSKMAEETLSPLQMERMLHKPFSIVKLLQTIRAALDANHRTGTNHHAA